MTPVQTRRTATLTRISHRPSDETGAFETPFSPQSPLRTLRMSLASACVHRRDRSAVLLEYLPGGSFCLKAHRCPAKDNIQPHKILCVLCDLGGEISRLTARRKSGFGSPHCGVAPGHDGTGYSSLPTRDDAPLFNGLAVFLWLFSPRTTSCRGRRELRDPGG